MAYDYDRLYGETPEALGAPTPSFVGFFARYETSRARVLDIGCGQGRDALFIARAGHRVVGVDLSPNGIAALTRAAKAQGLAIEGVVADVVDYRPEGRFDVVVIDRTLHMLDAVPRHAVLAGLLAHVLPGGWVLIADEPSNMDGLRAVFASDGAVWTPQTSKNGILFMERAQ